VDVEYMELGAVEAITRLAQQGLSVYMARSPKEPGKVKHEEQYATALARLYALPSVGKEVSVLTAQPLIEGEDLPDFWIRQEGENFFVFVANPLTQTIQYPLEYCYAFTDQGATRTIKVNHHGKSETIDLKFRPTESLLLSITPDGVEQIDTNYLPPMLRKG